MENNIDRSVNIFPVDRNGLVMLSKRNDTLSDRPGEWDIITGKIKIDEIPLQAALRTIKEEADLYVAMDHMVEATGNPQVNECSMFDYYHERYFYLGYLLVPNPEANVGKNYVDSSWFNVRHILDTDMIKHDVYKSVLKNAFDRGLFHSDNLEK